MATLRDIRDRIGSVKNTRKITRAMKLVAGAKLARATQAAMAAKPYQDTLSRVLARVVDAAGDVENPLLTRPENENDVLVVALSADRGLCGNFNSSINKATLTHIRALQAEGKNVRVICFGKKIWEFLKNRPNIEIADHSIDVDPKRYPDVADQLADRLVGELLSNGFSQCFLVYNEYISVMVQEARFDQILPMQIDAGDDDGEQEAGIAEYLYEPSGEEILGRLLPMALRGRVLQAFLETQAGEQAKRMTAMDAATRNASELISALTLDYNRARQAAITKELIEIVSGAEALQG
ncbi:MAG: ATP synthase F1 subunit gamma [Myxococcota bacterium]|nr:ATP synthase F1 subunit gamma [Myxococcota bacterium]